MKQKYPLLRCPKCGYTYRPTTHGWAFKTNKDTVCIGLDSTKSHAYGHPFEVVGEIGGQGNDDTIRC